MFSNSAPPPKAEMRLAYPSWATGLILLAVLVAFSPILLDLAMHFYARPWARCGVVFPLLVVIAVWLGPSRPQKVSRGLIWAAILFGLVIELVALGGGVPRFGRIGLVLAGVGVLTGAGLSSWPVALLLVWAISVPSGVAEGFSPALEAFWGRAGSMAIDGVDFDHLTCSLHWTPGDIRVPLGPHDGGLAMAYGFAGLGWFRGAMRSRSLAGHVRQAAMWGLIGVGVQLVLFTIAGLGLSRSSPPSAIRWALDHGGWLAQTGCGIVLAVAEFQATRRGGAGEGVQ